MLILEQNCLLYYLGAVVLLVNMTNLDIFGKKGSQMENLPLSEYLMEVSMGYFFDF